MRLFILFISVFIHVWVVNLASAQCEINAPRVACVGDLVAFSINNASGTISSYSWNFGTYGNSSNVSPSLIFTSQGTIVVSCTLTLAGGGQCKDTHAIEILKNPKAGARLSSLSDSCSKSNLICMENLMQKGERGLASLSILWGDGALTNKKNPLGDKWCHHYADTGVYEQTYELADSAGCKDKSFKIKVRIVPSPDTTVTYDSTYMCDSTKFCFTAKPSNGTNFTYIWQSLPSLKTVGINSKYCENVYRGYAKVFRAIITNNFGCKDTARLKVKAPDSGVSYAVGKRRLCSTQVGGGLTFNAGEVVDWEFNGKKISRSSFVNIYSAKAGWNYLKISSNVPCPSTFIDSFYMSILNIKAQIKNEFRTKVIDTLWVQDLSKNVPGSRIRRIWSFDDNSATQCTTWTKKNHFRTTNCNYSRDTIAWHYYKNPHCLYVRLSIYDSATECEADTVMQMARTDFCNPLISKKTICLDQFETFNISDLLNRKIKLKNYLLTDSKGKIDTLVFTGTQRAYKYSTPGFKSPIFWRYYDEDTVWTEKLGKLVIDYIRPARGWVADTFKNGIEVLYKPDATFDLKKISNCNPSKVELEFKDSIWKNPLKMTVNWGDTVIIYSNFKDSVAKLPLLSHVYRVGGDYTISVELIPKTGCIAKYALNINFGYYVRFKDLFSCNNRICFRDTVQDYDGKNKWSATNKLGKIYWDFGDGTKDSGFGKCHQFQNLGTFKIKISTVSTSGCVSEYSNTVQLSKAIAGIKFQPTIYCSEIRQYFDSSIVLGDTINNKIAKWNWDFGDGSAPVFLKNPAHIYSIGGVYRTRLIVTTTKGCRDTTYRNFSILGPQVSAKILYDSNGCAPLLVTFANQSKNTGNFIWEFGDKNNTFYSTKKDTNVSFKYAKPGVYYAHITGGDSFKNAITGSTYYCSIRYPAMGQNQLRITVYPGYFSEFKTPDTICLADSALVLNLSDTTNPTKYKWNMGNQDTFTRKYENFVYRYKNAGVYTISLKASQPDGTACLNIAERKITVLDLNTNFNQDCEKSNAPILYFKNHAGPVGPYYTWRLSIPPDTNQRDISKAKDLKFDFGFDTGTRNICLYVNIGNYCQLKSCKNIVLKNGIYLANVFTPGSIDGYNDSYKVPVFGYENYELRIFNRWGERIFYSNNPAYEWNGKVNNTGAELPSATYFYQFDYKDYCDKKMKMITGSINLIR